MDEWKAKLQGLKRTRGDRMIAGVCGGLGRATELPSWIWRAGFLASLLLGGLGAVIYLILAFTMPEGD